MLNHRQVQNFVEVNVNSLANNKIVQIQRICRRQNKCDSKTEFCFERGSKLGYEHFLLFSSTG